MNANWLLGALSPACQDFLAPRLMTKPINSGEVLYEAGAPLQNLIFPLDGLVSLQLQIKDGRLVENISLGRDGVLGGQYLIGETRLPSNAVTVISGRASWLPIPDFIEAMQLFPCVKPAIFACMARMMRRLMQGVACANVHSATQRISTWLLHTDDRVEAESFDLTQRTLANIFGLRPATVSDACNGLLHTGAIHYSRGRLSIMDRTLLEAQACECYESVRLHTLAEAGPLVRPNRADE
jgi:CRP-like cAMP-binding protein